MWRGVRAQTPIKACALTIWAKRYPVGQVARVHDACIMSIMTGHTPIYNNYPKCKRGEKIVRKKNVTDIRHLAGCHHIATYYNWNKSVIVTTVSDSCRYYLDDLGGPGSKSFCDLPGAAFIVPPPSALLQTLLDKLKFKKNFDFLNCYQVY